MIPDKRTIHAEAATETEVSFKKKIVANEQATSNSKKKQMQ